MMRTLPLALALAALALPALAAAPAGGDPANGQKLFIADGCYACHGTRGDGGGVAGPKIAPPPAVAAFTAQLRRPIQKMPAYSEVVVPASDISDIIAYLNTTPPSPKAADIPILQPR